MSDTEQQARQDQQAKQAKQGVGELLTEQINPQSVGLEQMSPLEIVTLMNEQDHKVLEACQQALGAVAGLIEDLVAHMRLGGRLFYVGAGTSGRLGTLDAAECPPTFGTEPELVVALMAGGPKALYSAVESAEDNIVAAAEELAALKLGAQDFVVGISASGNTPYVLGALRYAQEIGAGTGSIFCNPGSALSRTGEHPILLAVGPEVLTGSTRLKAGTATKLVLNMISTAAMVQLGHCLGNLMVDVKASNSKLVERKVRILSQAAGIEYSRAQELLQSADGDMRQALSLAQSGT